MCTSHDQNPDAHRIKQKLKKIQFRLKHPKYAAGPNRASALAEQAILRGKLREVLELANPQESPAQQTAVAKQA